METRDKATEEKSQQEPNAPIRSSTSWRWNPFSYLWGNSTPLAEVQQASGIVPNANAQEEVEGSAPVTLQEAHLLSQQNLTEQQHAVRPLEEQKQPEETLAQQEAELKTQQEISATFSSNMLDPFGLFGSTSLATPTEIIPESPSIINAFNASILTDNPYVSHVFRPTTLSPADDPHPGQAFANQTVIENPVYRVAEIAALEEISTEAEEERDRLRREQEELTVTIRLQQEQAQQTMLLQQEQEQQRAKVRAAEERRKAEEAFAKSCSTGARTLEEHYRLANAAVMRAGF